MTFKEELDKRAAYAEDVLRKYLDMPKECHPLIMEAVRYSALGGGKRLRPILMLETYRLFGGKDKGLIEPFLAAIEMIHSYSLVHDDLPAMDDDEYRRGRKTTHIVYGEALAVLAGDALLNLAFETACSAFDTCPKDSRITGEALQILFGKSGVRGMIGGQAADVEPSRRPVSEDELVFIYTLKTSALIEAAMMTGACLARASRQQIKAVESIARKAGLAFQIRDDILDMTGTLKVLGKPAHSDEKNEKTTYATLLGAERSEELVREYSREAAEELGNLNLNGGFLEELLRFLAERQK